MVEYGNGVGEVAGRAGGGTGVSGGGDPFANLSHLINDGVNTISSLPPEVLLAAVLAVLVGLIILKRAF